MFPDSINIWTKDVQGNSRPVRHYVRVDVSRLRETTLWGRGRKTRRFIVITIPICR